MDRRDDGVREPVSLTRSGLRPHSPAPGQAGAAVRSTGGLRLEWGQGRGDRGVGTGRGARGRDHCTSSPPTTDAAVDSRNLSLRSPCPQRFMNYSDGQRS